MDQYFTPSQKKNLCIRDPPDYLLAFCGNLFSWIPKGHLLPLKPEDPRQKYIPGYSDESIANIPVNDNNKLNMKSQT